MPLTTLRNSTIISLAVLKTNWDETRSDYLESFVPMIAESIRRSSDEVVSVGALQKQIEQDFGLRLPQHTLQMLLRRLARRKYLILDHHVYTRDNNMLAKLVYQRVQQSVVKCHEELIEKLRDFCREKFQANWTLEDAEAALQAYLKKHELTPNIHREQSSLLPDAERVEGHPDLYVAAFVRYLVDDHSSLLSYFETIVQGNMLANAILLADLGSAASKFHKTEVYFDTPFLISTMGYAGEPRQAPCLELLHLLKETDAQLRCFRHTLDEVQDILEYRAHDLDRGGLGRSFLSNQTIQYFIAKGWTASDIKEKILTLEHDLRALGITVVDKPEYRYEYVIDEQKLQSILAERVHKTKPNDGQTVNRDVDSISAILRLQAGKHPTKLEACRAIFITTNRMLVEVADDFFHQECGHPRVSVVPCLTDIALTQLLWLKKPLIAPNLPRKRIIADAFAAMQPSEQLWRKYLEELEKQKDRKGITPEQYYELRYSLYAEKVLMERTCGETDALTQATVSEMLQLIESQRQEELERRQKELQAQVLMTEIRAEEAENTLHQDRAHYQFREQRQKERIHARAQKLARAGMRGCLLITSLVFAAVTIAIGFGQALTIGPLLHWLTIGSGAVLSILSAVCTWGGFAPGKWINAMVEPQLAGVLERLQLAVIEDGESLRQE